MAKTTVNSEVSGSVFRIEAGPGTAVKEDDTIIILESMKMEIPIVATSAGTIVEILVAEGDAVEEDDEVAVIEG